MDSFDVLIVGAGHGGAQAAIALRQRGFSGSIALLGDEPDPPYERPALSKEFLAAEKPFERLLIRPVEFWAQKQIQLLMGHRIVEVNAEQHSVVSQTGEIFGYGQLIWAAGGQARRLTCEGHDLDGIHAIKTRPDVETLIQDLAGAQRVVVVGGGYIGLEAAAVLAQQGKSVTVIEALDRVLSRVAGSVLSAAYEAKHRANGVDFRFGTAVERIESDDQGRAAGVRLSTGEVVAANLVIVGIGIVPHVAPLQAAGAEIANGVRIDAHCRTTLPDVFAIGDGALHVNAFARGQEIRLESVQNATDMAAAVARTICGDPQPYHAVPWFWSNQYDLRLQTVGLSAGFDETVVRGDPDSDAFTVAYLRDGKVIALDCVNSTRDYVQGKALIISGARVPISGLRDADIPLKALIPA